MKRVPSFISGLAAVVLISACGAGTPQNETAREQQLGLWPMTTSSEEARQQVADGVRELDMARPEEAYSHFERALAADPNAAMAHLYAWASAQSLEAGYAHMAKAKELAPTASELERAIIEALSKSVDNDNEGALAAADRVVKLDPNNPRSWVLLGDMRDALAQRAEARAAWAKGIEIAPNFAPVYVRASISYTLVEPRDLPKGEELARKAVELEPNEPNVYDILGDALRAQGKLAEAAQAYTKQAELDPTKGAALQQRGHVNTFLGRYSEARADYDAAVALAVGNAKPGLAMYRALVHIYEGDRKAAIDELERLYNSIDGMNIPDPVGLKLFVAGPQFNTAVASGMLADAERFAKRLEELGQLQIKQAKSEEFARGVRATKAFRAGILATYKGDYARARQQAAEYMKIREPEHNPTRNRPAHDLLGLTALKERKFEEAVREFEQGSPNNIFTNYHHALALEGAGRAAEAQKLFDKVANFYFNNELLAMVHADAIAKVKKPTT
ncbi:MAG: tetratricopeptide repeat protein [Gemmatimonadota bacterium]